MYARIFKMIICVFLLSSISINLHAQVSQEQLGIQYFQDGEYEKAADVFGKIFETKQEPYIYSYYFASLMRLNNYKDAEKAVRKMMKNRENQLRYGVDLGFVFQQAGENDKAQKTYDKIIQDLTSDSYTIETVANAFLSGGNREYALKTLFQGRKLQKDAKAFTSRIVNIYQQLGQDEKAVTEILNLFSGNETKYLKDAETLLQNFMTEESPEKYEMVRGALLKLYQKNPDEFAYSYLLWWLALQQKDFKTALQQAKALDKRYKEGGQRLFEVAKAAVEHADYDVAIAALNDILNQDKNGPYFIQAKYALLDVKFDKIVSTYPLNQTDLKALEQDYQKALTEYGFSENTADWIKKYAKLLAFYLNKPQQAMQLLQDALEKLSGNSIAVLREKAALKIELADIQLYAGDVWEATLNYSQVEKDFPNDTIGQWAKFKNAKLSFYIGEFLWAKNQLDVLRAATSKLIANDAMDLSLLISDNEDEEDSEEEDEDSTLFLENLPLKYYAKADFLRYQNRDDDALKVLDTIALLNIPHKLGANILFFKAEIALKRRQIDQAVHILEGIVQYYDSDLLADDALFKLGEIHETILKDTGKAMFYYDQLIRNYSGSLFVIEARKRYRNLRGDNF